MSYPHALDADAQAHSDRLRALIAGQIAQAGGAIPFSRFMELALYAPGLGYYSAGATKFGRAGDYVTAPELGTLFAECVAEAVAPVLRQVAEGAQFAETCFVELGGGSGAFAEAAIRQLMALDAMPARYAILEPSADLRQRQRERLQRRLAPQVFDRVAWLDGPLQDPWHGVLFANEVIDALPTPRFMLRDGEVYEEYVTLGADGQRRAAMLSRTPLARTGTPEEIADAVHWLLARATYTTGQVVRIDGGRMLEA
jgi:SAM-dependent MidA family methyltransferase